MSHLNGFVTLKGYYFIACIVCLCLAFSSPVNMLCVLYSHNLCDDYWQWELCVHFRFSFHIEVHLRDSFFSHKHLSSLLPPLHAGVAYDLTSGQAGSSGETKQSHLVSQALCCPHAKQQTKGNYPALLPAPFSSCFHQKKSPIIDLFKQLNLNLSSAFF